MLMIHHEKQKSQPTVAITCFRRLSGIFRIDVHVAAETEYLAATDSSPGEPPVISRLEPTMACAKFDFCSGDAATDVHESEENSYDSVFDAGVPPIV